ncbi:MAG TPA: HAD-IC family P-type ATPase, partial [Chloroflexota bacterium]|nr:HAD-IC family P-type ATPase [Chloroflexota bacterium]
MIDPCSMADFNRDQPAETPSPAPSGLTESEVLARRAGGLGNVLPAPTGRTYREIVRENVFTFVNNVLFGLGIALILLGHWTDALVSVGVVGVNLVVGVVQEVRAKRILDRIALLTRPRATVIRDRCEVTVDPSQIVLGDVLVVRPGDQIVVDGEMLGNGQLEIDESLLTGESDLVTKTVGDPVFAGSACMSGHGYYEAQKVGAASLANELTARARSFRRVYTPLQREINLTVRIILFVAVSFGIVLVIDAIIEQIALAESVKMGVVVVGLVPNGLFLAIAVAYSMGAVRIARRRVLVQQLNAVESLSHVTVLCLDKTGTLTTGRLGFNALYTFDTDPEQVERWLGDFVHSTEAGNRTTAAISTTFPGEPRSIRDEVSFSSVRKWSALAFADPALPGTFVLGAPDVLLAYLNPRRVDDVKGKVAEWASAGLRVVLFARGTGAGFSRDAANQPVLPADLIPLALVSFRDELRPDTRDTLANFEAAGVHLKILSGDDPQTTRAVAIQAGFPADCPTISGLDLLGGDPSQLATVADETTIFGRLTPQQKQNLVQALQGGGQYVAFIGDGVNDVLALKQADLGIALPSGSQAASAV